MSRMPRFEQTHPDFGLDIEATPPWLIVGKGTTNVVELLHGTGRKGALRVVKSNNTRIATIDEVSNTTNTTRREFFVTGKSSGTTFIGVFDPTGVVPLTR